MTSKIAFINPVGTGIYDEQMARTLAPFAAETTELVVMHFEGVPEDIAFYVPKHIIELGLMLLAPPLETAGFDAIIVGCCFDPGVRVARETVQIPVVGPLEAAASYASYFGHDYSIITDGHPKSVPWIRDLVTLYGLGACRGVHGLEIAAPDMVAQPARVAEEAAVAIEAVLARDGSDLVLVGCTTVAACIEESIPADPRLAELPFVNPSTMALLTAEGLASLRRNGRYNLSRRGFYQQEGAWDSSTATDSRDRFGLVDASGLELALVTQGGEVAARAAAPGR